MTEVSKPSEGASPPRFSLNPPPPPAPPSPPAGAAAVPARPSAIPGAAAQEASGAKKKTARISLDLASSSDAAAPAAAPAGTAGVTSKTIRLTPPPPTPPTLSIPSAAPATRVLTRAPEDAKRQTSRISLETAWTDKATGESAASSPSATPKTIRIKRPMAPQPPAGAAAPAAAPSGPGEATLHLAKHETTRIESASDVPAEAQGPQRRTIKIRRADGALATATSVPRSLAVARLEAQAAERVASQAEGAPPHVLFPVAAAVALIVMGVVIYLLLAQAFPDNGMGFPGKITL